MSKQWVVNASPLILLAKVNHLNLLDQLSESYIVPEAVATEILAGPSDDPARQFLESTSINIIPVKPHPLIITWDLGAGETAVLSHALRNPPHKVIIDDGAARRCAHTHGIPIAGTLAIIITATQQQLIPSAKPVLQTLISYGFRIHDSILQQVLKETLNESWP